MGGKTSADCFAEVSRRSAIFGFHWSRYLLSRPRGLELPSMGYFGREENASSLTRMAQKRCVWACVDSVLKQWLEKEIDLLENYIADIWYIMQIRQAREQAYIKHFSRVRSVEEWGARLLAQPAEIPRPGSWERFVGPLAPDYEVFHARAITWRGC